MLSALRALAVAVGAVAVVATVSSAVRATILPRGVQNRTARLAVALVRGLARLRTGRMPSYEQRDRVMALLGPLALLVLLAMWLAILIGAYTLMYLGVTTTSAAVAFELSGSSVFTLGTTTSKALAGDILSYSEAGLGLLLLTLMITYLPSIYGAFSRRENGVGLLRVRAGVPPRAVTMLVRYHLIEGRQLQLTDLWRVWEAWFVDVEETHSTFPVLAFFRSPQPDQSWVTSAGALLDGASFWVAAVGGHPVDPDAQLCIREGFQCLQRVGALFGLEFDAHPSPTDPISVSRQEWDAAVEEMAAAGVPLVADREQAWLAWRGWRVNYDAVLLELARMVEAPPAPWLSDRSPLGAARATAWRRLVRAPGRRASDGRPPGPPDRTPPAG